MKAIIGRKIGMSRIFQDGKSIPVTLVVAKPNVITQIKTEEKDGYQAIQLGLPEDRKIKKPQMSLGGSDVKIGILKEFDVQEVGDFKVTQKLNLSQFQLGDKVKVSGVSKGKGFAGTVKRHNFHLGPKTHGSDNYRRPGSIGSMYPQRVIKGRRMAGHLGHQKVTLKNLHIVGIDQKNNVLILKGAIPGANKSPVFIWSN